MSIQNTIILVIGIISTISLIVSAINLYIFVWRKDAEYYRAMLLYQEGLRFDEDAASIVLGGSFVVICLCIFFITLI